MINNDVNNPISRYFNRNNNVENTGAAEVYKRIKAKHDVITGKVPAESETEETEENAAANKSDKSDIGSSQKKQNQKKQTSTAANLSPEERRQAELKAILDKINREDGTYSTTKSSSTNASANANVTSGVISSDDMQNGDLSGIQSFLNDLPLFDEFKTGLMDAFKLMDKGTMGAINAQYELNYTSMQAVANAAGGFDYQEVTVNLKFDLNYIKAAAGNGDGAAMADRIGGATDFASLMQALQGDQQQTAQAGSTGKSQFDPKDLLASMQDYFSPENTAGRIVDFATAFFPMSEAFKKGGDTEEARAQFAETMRAAVQKGFDQAAGILGKNLPKNVQEGIDKTHELTFKGFDDFVKNGLNKNKESNGVYSGLQALAFSFQYSYSSTNASSSTSRAASSSAAANSTNNSNAAAANAAAAAKKEDEDSIDTTATTEDASNQTVEV